MTQTDAQKAFKQVILPNFTCSIYSSKQNFGYHQMIMCKAKKVFHVPYVTVTSLIALTRCNEHKSVVTRCPGKYDEMHQLMTYVKLFLMCIIKRQVIIGWQPEVRIKSH